MYVFQYFITPYIYTYKQPKKMKDYIERCLKLIAKHKVHQY